MDIIRCIACFCVLSVHFFHNNGFYSVNVEGGKMYVMTFMRSSFMICVPLFILLSGYLLKNKKPDANYYKKIGRILFVYLVITIMTAIYNSATTGKPIVFVDFLKGLLGFDIARYVWYVEMYIGLFLLIPFLNILYNNIPTAKQKRILIATLIALVALPGVLNVYNLSSPGWWAAPEASGYWKLIPSFWTVIYPVMYYFIGCYLREFGLRIKTWVNFVLIVVSFFAVGAYNLWRSSGVPFVRGGWTDWPSFFNVANAVLVFAFFMNLKYERMPDLIKTGFAKLSDLCFGIYLCSGFFDTIIYKRLNAAVPVMPDRLPYYFVVVPLSFVCSALASYLIMKLYALVAWVIGKAAKLLKKKEKTA